MGFKYRRNVERVIKRDTRMQVVNGKFSNKPIHIPVNAKYINNRYQTDVVNFLKFKSCHNGVCYKYILSVMDIF